MTNMTIPGSRDALACVRWSRHGSRRWGQTSRTHLGAYLLSCMLLTSGIAYSADISFSNAVRTPIVIPGPASSGLKSVFVLDRLEGVSMDVSVPPNSKIAVRKFDSKGAAYAEDITFEKTSQGHILIDNLDGNCGYEITTGTETEYVWIVDYSKFRFEVSSISLSPGQDCDATVIDFSGAANPIHYYSITGSPLVLSRDIALSFQTAEWNEEEEKYVEVDKQKSLPSVSGEIRIIPAILVSSEIKLTGDRFLREWGLERNAGCMLSQPYAVACETRAEQIGSGSSGEESNLVPSGSDALGGSAPAEILFSGFITEGVEHCEWQMATDSEFEDITYRLSGQDLDFTFSEEGTVYVRFVASNADGSCESTGETYTVDIGQSLLRIPNAFTPDGDGINDVWRVAYRSLIDFECTIFDRQGHKLYNFKEPSGGWDGKRNGKTVKPGVYFYVIKATGADGKRYNKSGDINILGRSGNQFNTDQ